MADIQIRTDHKWKPFKYRNEIPSKILESDFSHLSEDDSFDGWIVSRRKSGRLYFHLSDFMRIDSGSPFPSGWEGYSPCGYGCGFVIQVSADGERYRLGWYNC